MGLVRNFRGLIKPTSFNIIPSSASIKVGSTYEIPYEIVPSNSTNQKINWSSSNTNIATVSNGIVTPVDEGTVTITGTTDYLGFTDTISIEITVVPVTGVTLNESSIIVNAGETFQLEATITPADAGDQSVTWSSSNTSVATVSSNGLVTYVSDGNATITVTTNDGGYTASCSVACVSFVPVDTCFGYTGAEQSIILEPHAYCIEVWGAQGGCGCCGGSSPILYGGKGGYSGGCITITNTTCLYVYVGGLGCTVAHSAGLRRAYGGWNGGGCTYTVGTGSGGGGGTDIRIGGNTLYHRRIVAGGGGGGGWTSCGGAGGGCCGVTIYGGGGTQTAGGSRGSDTTGCTTTSAGIFGVGGNGTGYSEGGGGGGGGWYGGGGNGYRGGAGGGSGYVYNSSTCSSAPSGYCHCTAYFLTNAYTCCGCCSFPTASGGTEIGHSGCGCVRIRSL